MRIQCRPVRADDFGVIECSQWESLDDFQRFLREQGIASMLAYDRERYLGHLYPKECDQHFRDPRGRVGERPWADLHLAELPDLEGRFLTLGCYCVGWMRYDSSDTSLYDRGIGTALLTAVFEWYENQQATDGLPTWALPPGSIRLLGAAGQMPYTVHGRFGFEEIKQVDPGWDFKPSIGRPILKLMTLAKSRRGTRQRTEGDAPAPPHLAERSGGLGGL